MARTILFFSISLGLLGLLGPKTSFSTMSKKLATAETLKQYFTENGIPYALLGTKVPALVGQNIKLTYNPYGELIRIHHDSAYGITIDIRFGPERYCVERIYNDNAEPKTACEVRNSSNAIVIQPSSCKVCKRNGKGLIDTNLDNVINILSALGVSPPAKASIAESEAKVKTMPDYPVWDEQCGIQCPVPPRPGAMTK
jgi:hypothetical protein